MRYKVAGREIRTENTAKPVSQASAPLINWLKEQSRFRRTLDYGCGKLRYARVLAENSKSLTLVDSAVQLDREQIIDGERTTIRRYADRWPHARVMEVQEFLCDDRSFDFVLCANVLSAIPSRSARSKVLGWIRDRLAGGGTALFVVQFRNSFYRELPKRQGVTRHLDGYLLRTRRGTSYYGIIPPDNLVEILRTAHFKVGKTWSGGESAFVLAHR